MSKKKNAIIFKYENGTRIIIKRNKITALKGNDSETTIYFGGTSFIVDCSLDIILSMWRGEKISFIKQNCIHPE